MGVEEPVDSELWRRACEHDGLAFGLLFDRHAKRVYNHCFRRTADWSVAEDLTSVVFLEAWRKRKDLRLHSDSILPWLLAVANNCLRNTERSRRRYRRLLAKLPRAFDIQDPDIDIAGRIDDEKQMRNVLESVRQLRAEDQEIIALCDWTGLSHQEASTALGIPVGTVKSRLSRARERLRDQIGLPDTASYDPRTQSPGANPR